jgi:hypothetical protein
VKWHEPIDTAIAMKVHTFVSVTIPDSPGSLGKIAGVLAGHHINIEGFSVERGNIRFMTDQPEEAKEALVTAGHSPSLIEVIEMRMPNQPGALARLGEALGEQGVNILSTFGLTQGDSGSIFLRLSDLEKARAALQKLRDQRVTA